jgi:hypothetical protein
MTTTDLRTMTAQAAATVPNSRLWPNGIGFNCGTAQYSFSEQSSAWIYATEAKVGTGDTPSSAKANAKLRDGGAL